MSRMTAAGTAIWMLLLANRGWSAHLPTLASELELPGEPTLVRATPDGHRALVGLSVSPGETRDRVLIVDVGAEGSSVIVGSVSLEGAVEDMAIASDGHSALVLAGVGKAKSPLRTRAVLSLDLSDPNKPVVRELQELPALNGMGPELVALAGDAGSYAYIKPQATNSTDAQIIVHRITDNLREITVDAGSPDPAVALSFDGRYLAYGMNPFSVGNATVVDLRPVPVSRFSQEYAEYQDRYHCLLGVLPTGQVLLDDARTPRIGLYAPQTGMPRVGILPYVGEAACDSLTVDARGSAWTFSTESEIERVEVQDPRNPRITTSWLLPVGVHLAAFSDTRLFATAPDKRLRIYRLDQSVADAGFDWQALDRLYTKAMLAYAANKTAIVRDVQALQALQAAGAAQALRLPLSGLSPGRAAAIFNDYGFFVTKTRAQPAEAERAIRRAIELDPARTVAYLNLADLSRARLASITTVEEKTAATTVAVGLYKTYLAKGGKTNGRIDRFLAAVAAETAGLPVCAAVAAAANDGRLQDFIAGGAIDLPVQGKRLDIVFTSEGTAHVPSLHAFDAVTDAPAELNVEMPWGEELWGGDQLGLFIHVEGPQIIHYRDATHPVHVASLSKGDACEFTTAVTETIAKDAIEPKLCEDLIAGTGPESIVFDQDATLDPPQISDQYSETEAGSLATLDLANNGTKVKVVALSLSSGAGAGCEETFFDVLNETGDHLGTGKYHDLIMQMQKADPANRYPILPCGNSPRFFKYQGNVYYESTPTEWPPADVWHQYHTVNRIESGQVRDVCGIQFQSGVSYKVGLMPKPSESTQ